MNKKLLSERDICTKFITPALKKAEWDELTQLREEVSFTKGRIVVRGKLVTRDKAKRADYVLYYKPNIPLALIEAKDNARVYQAVTGPEERQRSSESSHPASSTSSSSTSATGAALPRILPGARSWSTSPRPPRSA